MLRGGKFAGYSWHTVHVNGRYYKAWHVWFAGFHWQWYREV